MSSPICPSCQRQQVVATAQFCPFCGYAFLLGGSVGGERAAPSIPPGYPLPVPPPPTYATQHYAPPVPRAMPAASPVASRTTSARAIGVTAAVGVLALVVAYYLWNVINHPNAALDQKFSDFVFASHGAIAPLASIPNPLDPKLLNDGYTLFMILLVSIAPMVVVVSYWFSLRRLYQEWAPSVWFKTFWINVVFYLCGLTFLGGLLRSGDSPSTNAGWALLLALYYPMLLVLALLASFACAVAGILFGRWFARWPLERIRALRSSAWQDALLVGLVGFGALFLQELLAPRFVISPVVPLAALAVAAFACWSALRPLGSNSQQP